MIGSISHWKLHGVFDPKTNKGTEVGEVTFGVHTTHGDNSIIYHGAVISAEPNAHNHKQVDSAGWMKITGVFTFHFIPSQRCFSNSLGGKGSMKGATGGASHSCTFKVEHNKVHCFMVGNIVLP